MQDGSPAYNQQGISSSYFMLFNTRAIIGFPLFSLWDSLTHVKFPLYFMIPEMEQAYDSQAIDGCYTLVYGDWEEG